MRFTHRPASGVILLLGLFLIAAAVPAKPPVITITKTDNTSVRGQLTASDPKSLSITPMKKGVAEGEPVVVPWSDVKSVSNGFTRAKAIEQWKKEHPEDRCADCHGTGKIACPTCKGTGRDPKAANDCPTCHGQQTIACTTPKCDKGQIPCPKSHLKLTEGTWYKKEDGTKWRKFPVHGGYFEVSEHHLGQVVDLTGDSPGVNVCPLCAGKFIIEDPKCHGTGSIPCATCEKSAVKEKCPDCEKGFVSCKTCDGTGLQSLAKPAS